MLTWDKSFRAGFTHGAAWRQLSLRFGYGLGHIRWLLRAAAGVSRDHRRPDDGLRQLLHAFYEMSHTSVWRASSLTMAIPIFLFVAKIPGRRRAATKASIPFYVGFLLLFQFLAGAYLVLNAVGWPAPPQLAPFALALTVMLFTTAIAYLIALARALRGDRGQK